MLCLRDIDRKKEVVELAKNNYWLTSEGLTLLEGWARDGFTNKQIAQNMGIAISTLYEWKNKFSEISDTLKKGKEVVDYQIENALRDSALSGNVTAQIFWLKNRRPDKWRDKPIENVDINEQEAENDALTASLKELAKELEENVD